MALLAFNDDFRRRDAGAQSMEHLDTTQNRVSDNGLPKNTVQFLKPRRLRGAFGPMISDETTLMFTFARFEDPRGLRDDDLSRSVSLMSDPPVPPMDAVAGGVSVVLIGALVTDGRSLDAQMERLATVLRNAKARARRLHQPDAAVSGGSPDVYGQSLRLLN